MQTAVLEQRRLLESQRKAQMQALKRPKLQSRSSKLTNSSPQPSGTAFKFVLDHSTDKNYKYSKQSQIETKFSPFKVQFAREFDT